MLKEKGLPANARKISAFMYCPTNSNIRVVLSDGVADCCRLCVVPVLYDVRRVRRLYEMRKVRNVDQRLRELIYILVSEAQTSLWWTMLEIQTRLQMTAMLNMEVVADLFSKHADAFFRH